MKKGILILLDIFVILILSSSAIAGLDISFGPLNAYETNSVDFQLNISNFRNSYDITDIAIELEGHDISAAVDYKGWTETYGGNHISWSDGVVSNNVLSSVFEFLGAAQVVEENTAYNAQLTLTDSDSEEHTFTYELNVLNDDSAAVISEVVPQDGSFISDGIDSYLVSANIIDAETGIENVTFNWVRCGEENITPTEFERELRQTEGIYQADIDFSSYADGQIVCYSFHAYNKGGDKSEYTGTLTVDGVPPEVTLVSPLYDSVVGLNKNFSFFASDNMAAEMTCSMWVDSDEFITGISAEDMDVEFIPSEEAEEGKHTWSVRCSDSAGLVGISDEWVYTLDKTPPAIEAETENDSIVSEDAELHFSVSDNFSLARVYFKKDDVQTRVDEEFSIHVSDWPDGPNEFAVIAEDSVGNRAEQTYQVIVDRTSPEIVLVSPDDGSISDVHVGFTYRAEDMYDEEVDCTILADEQSFEEQTVESGVISEVTEMMAEGDYEWKVQCIDDAGNIGESELFAFSVIDTSGPDIVFDIPDYVFRGDTVRLSLEVTDVSGVDDVRMVLRYTDDHTQSIPLESIGDVYYADVDTSVEDVTGSYILEVYAVDALNNSNTGEASYELHYRYVVELNLEPAVVEPSERVDLSGTIMFDTGGNIEEDSVLLSLPWGEELDLDLADDGSFTSDFFAPQTEGSYDISVSVISEENSKEYGSVETLVVRSTSAAAQESGGASSGGSGSSGVASYSLYEDESCFADWSCTAWTECSGSTQKKICVDLNHCFDSKRTETRECVETDGVEEDDSADADGLGFSRVHIAEPQSENVVLAETNRPVTTGVGKATSFLNLGTVSTSFLIFVLFLTALLVGVLYKFGWSKGDKRKKPSAIDIIGSREKIDLDDYLAKRAQKRL